MPERQSLRSQLILGYHSTLGAIVSNQKSRFFFEKSRIKTAKYVKVTAINRYRSSRNKKLAKNAHIYSVDSVISKTKSAREHWL